jgi:alpha-amylase
VVVTPPLNQPRPTRQNYHGDGRDVILQGFHWDSWHGHPEGHNRKSWYRILADNAGAIKSAGFTWVWFPPVSDSLDPHGYLPRRWYRLDTPYGNEGELVAAINALAPVKSMADVILNHRVGACTPGCDFEEPRFPNNQAAVVRNDECGAGAGNCDTGEMYPGGRDLDHTNHDVRETIKEYLHSLKALGFQGWRYDFVKGFHGRYVSEYNDATGPEFSVGEYYDGDRQKVTHWIDAAHGKTTAFDFPLRFTLYESCVRDEYSRLRASNNGRVTPAGLIGFWPSRAVTFLENHDTEYRRDEEHQRCNDDTRHFLGKAVQMGYAYILTHPGNPCVFWSHFFDWGRETRERIEALLALRKRLDIHAQSSVQIREARKGLYAAVIDEKLAVKLGSQDWNPGHGWNLAVFGEKFAVWKRHGVD